VESEFTVVVCAVQRLNGHGADLAAQEPYMLRNNPRHVYLILVVPRHDINLLSKGRAG
jgi:hypothetical protein